MSRLGPYIISSDDTAIPAVLPASPDILSATQGGTGLDTSAVTGIPELRAGTWYFPPNHINVWNYLSTAQQASLVAGTATECTTEVQTALDAAVALSCPLIFPRGVYLISSMLTVTGVLGATGDSLILQGAGCGHDFTPGTVLKWGGASDISAKMFKANGIGRLSVRDILFHGDSKVGVLFWATQDTGTYAPYGWSFENCGFWSPKAWGMGINIDTTTNMALMRFSSCEWRGSANSTNYYCTNSNSLTQQFYQCAFDGGAVGLIPAGNIHLFGCAFSNHTTADISLGAHAVITAHGIWTEQSNRFLVGDSRSQYSSVTLVGCDIYSYPWLYWKLDEDNRTQPTNDVTQWGAILWDRPGALNLIGCQFGDAVYNGAETGAVAPLASQMPGVVYQYSTNLNINNIGSHSFLAANTGTYDGFIHAWSEVALGSPKVPIRRNRYAVATDAAVTIRLGMGSLQELTLQANTVITIDITGADVGEVLTLIMTQGGVGSFSPAWAVTPKLTGGAAFVPTATVGARSVLVLLWDGTYWNEVSRALDIK